jgi:hypothetical protein
VRIPSAIFFTLGGWVYSYFSCWQLASVLFICCRWYPAIALLAARECAASLRDGEKTNRQVWVRRLPALAVVLGAVNMALAVAIPVSRTVQEDSNDQEEFVEEVVAKITGEPIVYASPDFPETVLLVLSYRLNRSIPLHSLQCEVITTISAASMRQVPVRHKL